MLVPLIYLVLFSGGTASLFFSTKFFRGESAQHSSVKEIALANALIIFLAWVCSFVPFLGFPLAMASIIYFILNFFTLRLSYSILVFLIQLAVLGGLKAILVFLLFGGIGLI